jgi:hypothetical protein
MSYFVLGLAALLAACKLRTIDRLEPPAPHTGKTWAPEVAAVIVSVVLVPPAASRERVFEALA